jgi:hypothetical protein
MHEKPDLSVVIVTWNSESEIYECIRSVNESCEGLAVEFVIVDNASQDNSVNEVKRTVDEGIHNVSIILNNSNLGYARACNQGIDSSQGKHVLLLNPDTKAVGDCVLKLMKKLESDDSYGAAAPQLLNTDGSIQHSCRTFPEYRDMFFEFTLLSSVFRSSKLVSRWKMRYFGHDIEAKVDQPMAAALLIKGDLLRKLGGFDDQFVMFFNDVDLCKRIVSEGKSIIFFPEAKLYHAKGASVKKNRKAMIDAWNEDCRKYFRKYYNDSLKQGLLDIGLLMSGIMRKFYYSIRT